MSISPAPASFVFNRLFIGALTLMPLLAVILPRFMAFAPLLLALIGAGCFFAASPERRAAFSKAPLIISAAIMTLTGLSVLWALDPAIAGDRAVKLVMILIPGALLLGFHPVLGREALRDFAWVLPWTAIAAAALLIVELYFNAPLYHAIRGLAVPEEFNLSSLNRAVVCIILTLPCAAFIVRQSGFTRKKTLVMLGLIAAGAALILYKTESQSAQLAAIVGTLFWALHLSRFKATWIVLTALIAAALFSAPWLSQFAFKTLAENLHHAPWLQHGYAAERLEIWDYVGRYALEHPFHGFGIEATRAVEAFDTAEIYQKGVTILHPHNFALQIWIEFGLLGVIPAIAFFGYLLYRLTLLPLAASRLGLGVTMASLSIAATGYGLWQSWWVGEVVLITLFFILLLRIHTDKSI